ncbi:pseudouridine synthase [Sneathia vaginalis]|uniref:Pseudouridine synthase n=1 Tax=Sneathia vaginalis TaxID=187101 RepID=A0A0E3UV96_9FUSO|nr:pseudouridine synthase [Sneathia vaginalis]AKC96078.1 pseudouridine synthase [Sneathia vaginalis]
MRINKYIALSGFCSRRKADELIDIGRVTINKDVAKKGDEVRENDVVRIDGERVRVKLDQYEYYILNKPKRVICSNEDKFGRVTAVSLINSNKRLFTYGRLDYLTEGLIIISNDGDLYNKIMHPRQKLYKSYIATIDKEITEDHIEALSHGVVIDGVKTAPAKVKVLTKTEVRIAIFEGRNRQIRKMFEVLGYFVKSLKRVKVGELTLKNLEVGKYRKLTKDEIEYLKKL